ncbi:MAG TPA: ThuA domain-containing protein [Planctomycetaceae bacterium]|nr:ThuA domain-containing protein [Planctomycetaceae bacterium]
MKRCIGWLLAALAGFGFTAASAEEAVKPLKVCLLSGCDTYKSEESLPPFQEFLERHYNVRCTRLVRKAVDDLPGLEQLDDCDVAFVFIKRMQLKGDQLERFQKYATSGRPIVAVRTASHAVQTWLEFDREVLGGNYMSHHPVGPVTQIRVKPAGAAHPILAGVALTTANDSLYKNLGHAADIQVLLDGTIDGQPTEPLAWTREYKGGRIFYTSLGAQDTFQEPAFRRMLANALFWTAKRDVQTIEK